MGWEFVGHVLGFLVLCVLTGLLLMLVVSGLGLGWSYPTCFGIMVLVVGLINFAKSG